MYALPSDRVGRLEQRYLGFGCRVPAERGCPCWALKDHESGSGKIYFWTDWCTNLLYCGQTGVLRGGSLMLLTRCWQCLQGEIDVEPETGNSANIRCSTVGSDMAAESTRSWRHLWLKASC